MNELICIYIGIGAFIGMGMTILFIAEKTEYPLLVRLLAAAVLWILVTTIWPVTLMVLILGKLRR